MKKLLPILTLLFSTAAFAQANYPLNIEYGNWNVQEITSPVSLCNDCCKEYSLYFQGDTVIGNYTYEILHRKGINYLFGYDIQSGTSYQCGDSISGTTDEVAAFIRNDSINKKVFIYDTQRQVDTLLYNFDLAVGDTLADTYVFSAARQAYPYHVVDSIGIQNVAGSNRKVFYLNTVFGTQSSYTLYEGIGFDSTINLIAASNTSIEYERLCYKDQNGKVPANANCNLITSLDQHTSKQAEFAVSPNPTNGRLKIETTEPLNSIAIYNLQGQRVMEVNPRQRQFELPEERGLYFILMTTKEGEVISKKVVKR
ncbi:MAG: T9SS type A sorting domain-containing protein [Vicingaceae bacterium]